MRFEEKSALSRQIALFCRFFWWKVISRIFCTFLWIRYYIGKFKADFFSTPTLTDQWEMIIIFCNSPQDIKHYWSHSPVSQILFSIRSKKKTLAKKNRIYICSGQLSQNVKIAIRQHQFSVKIKFLFPPFFLNPRVEWRISGWCEKKCETICTTINVQFPHIWF